VVRVGLELGADRVCAVWLGALSGRPLGQLEIPWDPVRPEDLVVRLRHAVGPVRSLSVAIGVSHLRVKRLRLPPVRAAEARRIVALEPERYFADASTPLATALVDREGPAFAVPRDLVASWLTALESLAPVNWIGPAPLALATFLRSRGTGSGVFLVEDGGKWVEVVLGDGVLRAVRRLQSPPTSSEAPPPPLEGSGWPCVAALGAVRMKRDAVETMLAPAEWLARRQRQLSARLLLAGALAGLALVAALWSLDGWRSRTLQELGRAAEAAAARASGAEQEHAALLSRAAEAQLLQWAEGRPDPMRALAALGAALPRDVQLLSAKSVGDDWEIRGTAPNAAALVPLLDRSGHFENVRLLGAVSRYTDGKRTYEAFSLAFGYQRRR
jgi:hypothetical protein